MYSNVKTSFYQKKGEYALNLLILLRRFVVTIAREMYFKQKK